VSSLQSQLRIQSLNTLTDGPVVGCFEVLLVAKSAKLFDQAYHSRTFATEVEFVYRGLNELLPFLI
jgi:hypothetical protein